MQFPPPAVFHDKAKRTQQGNLLEKNKVVFTEGEKVGKMSS